MQLSMIPSPLGFGHAANTRRETKSMSKPARGYHVRHEPTTPGLQSLVSRPPTCHLRFGTSTGVPDARLAWRGGSTGVPDARLAWRGGSTGVPDAIVTPGSPKRG